MQQTEGSSGVREEAPAASAGSEQRAEPQGAIPTLGDLCQGRANNFDFLRFMAALFVILSHSTPLTGLKIPEPLTNETTGQMSFGRLGVIIFFFLSGFLITGSFMNSRSLVGYLKARALRIFPGLFTVLLLSIVVLGPLVTNLPLGEYFGSRRTWDYLLSNMTLYNIQYDLPGVFTNNAYPGAVNGSLWTLPLEVFYYLVVAALGITGLLKWRPVVILLILVALNTGGGGFYRDMFPFFGAGMVFYLYRNQIPYSGRLALLSAACLVVAARVGGLNDAMLLFGAYLVFWVAFNRRLPLSRFARFGDFSYGLYIYAFPVQQTISYLYGGPMDRWLHFALAVPATVVCAALSWHLVEKHFLKLKKVSFRAWAGRLIGVRSGAASR